MNLAAIDLNLLLVFDAMMEERNTKRAGLRVGLSQPAVSHALSRLRDALGDELFVRTSDGMQPTLRALELAGPLRQALRQLQAMLEPAKFVPAETTRQFSIATSDRSASALLTTIIERMRREAPRAELQIRPIHRIDVAHELDIGALDIAILGAPLALPERFRAEPGIEEPLVWVMRADHPLASRALTLEDLASAAHLGLSLTGGEPGEEDYIEQNGLKRRVVLEGEVVFQQLLAARGLTRHTPVTVPFCSMVPFALAKSDMVALLPERTARHMKGPGPLVIRESPIALPPFSVVVIWHERQTGQAAHRWLRRLFLESCPGVTAGDGAAPPERAPLTLKAAPPLFAARIPS